MPYRFLEDTAIADVAFEAEGRTLKELFEAAALAVTGTMVKNVGEMAWTAVKNFKIEAEDVEMLLFHFLQELIYLKDAELLLFNAYDLDVGRNMLDIGLDVQGWRLCGRAWGERIDADRHELLVDVKAVSLHDYRVEETPEGWRATVILDI